ncbi:very long chain fatty acid elongase AAEL008004-like [Culicoides brevitarsis]|uniref:very long chain fatty acid elongase AAEL008004-like n=1 Tax=Culicoides brevitarsis TaxID=469753 RepID=UPI00307C89AA
MALILRTLWDYTYFLFNEYKDPRNEHFPLLGSPFPIFGILAAYLYFVLSIGPRFMENRKPFDIQRIINWYNIAQVVINLFIGVVGLKYSYLQPDFSLRCQPIDHKTTPERQILLKVCYGFLLSRMFDLLDTIFFVLRKRDRQISFLHLYHHAGIVFGAYIFNKFMAGSHSVLLGIVNSFVHVFMYGYYFLTSFKPELKASIWWKKHITQIQIIQFVILVVHFGLPLFYTDCNHPKALLFTGAVQNLFMLILFSDFYIKAYLKKPKTEEAIKQD